MGRLSATAHPPMGFLGVSRSQVIPHSGSDLLSQWTVPTLCEHHSSLACLANHRKLGQYWTLLGCQVFLQVFTRRWRAFLPTRRRQILVVAVTQYPACTEGSGSDRVFPIGTAMSSPGSGRRHFRFTLHIPIISCMAGLPGQSGSTLE